MGCWRFCQVAVYVAAAIGMRRVGRLSGIHRLVTFLVSSNLSILHAWFQVARGRRVVLWEPSLIGERYETEGSFSSTIAVSSTIAGADRRRLRKPSR